MCTMRESYVFPHDRDVPESERKEVLEPSSR